jgi:hypothetical protein
MRTYERPTLTKAGSFKKVTGPRWVGAAGLCVPPPDALNALSTRLADRPVPALLATIDRRPVGPGLGLFSRRV